MRRTITLILGIILLLTPPLLSKNKKLAQTGFKFLSVASDARGGALNDALTTVEAGSASLFFNPAGMARMPGHFDATFSQNTWIADIKHNSYSLAFSPSQGRYGVFGMSLMSVDYGKVLGTMVWGNSQGYVDTEILKPTAWSIGFGYAKALSDKFAVGGQVKINKQELGSSFIPVGDSSLTVQQNLAIATAFDFGTQFRTGFKSLVFGMSVRNFSNEIKYEKEGFQLPLTFRIGLSMNVLDIFGIDDKKMSCLVTTDAVHYRDYPEQIKIGVEYKLLEMFALRVGYVAPADEQNLSYGFGISKFGASIDYAYTPFGILGDVKRFTLRIGL